MIELLHRLVTSECVVHSGLDKLDHPVTLAPQPPSGCINHAGIQMPPTVVEVPEALAEGLETSLASAQSLPVLRWFRGSLRSHLNHRLVTSGCDQYAEWSRQARPPGVPLCASGLDGSGSLSSGPGPPHRGVEDAVLEEVGAVAEVAEGLVPRGRAATGHRARRHVSRSRRARRASARRRGRDHGAAGRRGPGRSARGRRRRGFAGSRPVRRRSRPTRGGCRARGRGRRAPGRRMLLHDEDRLAQLPEQVRRPRLEVVEGVHSHVVRRSGGHAAEPVTHHGRPVS